MGTTNVVFSSQRLTNVVFFPSVVKFATFFLIVAFLVLLITPLSCSDSGTIEMLSELSNEDLKNVTLYPLFIYDHQVIMPKFVL